MPAALATFRYPAAWSATLAWALSPLGLSSTRLTPGKNIDVFLCTTICCQFLAVFRCKFRYSTSDTAFTHRAVIYRRHSVEFKFNV